jgi:hypothetical protein
LLALMAARKMIQLRVAAGVFSCCAGLSHGLSSSVSVGGSTQLPVLLHSNPLKELSELPKTHFSWPFPAEFFDSDVSFLDGAMHDYVRITGSCALLLADTQHELNATSVAACVAICRAVAPQRAAVGKPPPVLSVQYSPWYRLFPGTDPRPAGAPEAAELKFFTAQLTALKAAAPETGAGSLGAVLIDSEKFKVQKNSTAEYNASLTRKHDLLWNATRAVFPGVRIVQYDRGTVRKSEAQSTWTPSQQYALDELGDSYSVSLYRLPEIWEMRGTMLHTVALAKARNVTSVIPWVSLSSGDRRVANRSMLSVFDYRWNYDRVYVPLFLSNLYIKMIILPRQARDKHRKS